MRKGKQKQKKKKELVDRKIYIYYNIFSNIVCVCVCVCEIWVKRIVWQSTRCKNVSITIVISCYFSFAYLLNMLKWTFSYIIVLSKFNGIPSKKICCSYSTYKQLFEIMFASNTGLYRLLKRQSTRERCNLFVIVSGTVFALKPILGHITSNRMKEWLEIGWKAWYAWKHADS